MPSSQTQVQKLMLELSGHHWINNEYIAGLGSRSPIIDPATSQQCGEFAHALPEEIDDAVKSAARAQHGTRRRNLPPARNTNGGRSARSIGPRPCTASPIECCR